MKIRYLAFLFCTLFSLAFAAETAIEPYENLVVKKITVNIENQSPGDLDESQAVVFKLKTKQGDRFNQEMFDQDLKVLAEEFEWVEPHIRIENHEAIITLDIQKRPSIKSLTVQGSTFKDKKILKEAELTKGVPYNRETFYKSIHKIREFLIKKGFFKAEVSYTVNQIPRSNEVEVDIYIEQGPKGHINDIVFKGFTSEEEKEVMRLIRVRKFNILYSWLTGSGVIKQSEMDPDVQSIVDYLQNQGYADAYVTMKIEDIPNNKLALVISLDRGAKYHIQNINFSGETLIDEKLLAKATKIKSGDVFSLDKIRASQERLKKLYTKDGYLHTNVDYSLNLNAYSHTYDVNFSIEESEQYRVGLVMVSGNYSTTKNVVYNNIDIEPGEVFNSTKIKSTQDRLRSTGYFDNVNVYPVKCEQNPIDNSEYCDVMVEVNEAQTGNASVFVGFSSTSNVFGGIDLTENNFNASGLGDLFTKGPKSLRGGGEYLQIKGQIGVVESEVGVTWLDPYYNDSLWRIGADFTYGVNSIVSPNYRMHTLGGALSAKYPISPTFTYGTRFRARNSRIRIFNSADNAKSDNKNADEEEPQPVRIDPLAPVPAPEILPTDQQNSGFVAGIAFTAGYDSTDSTTKPRKGIRSNFEAEFAGLVRRQANLHDFPFLKFGYLNSFYYPVWAKGTFKLRGDFKFINPLWNGTSQELPLTERFFLGGIGTVRGFAPGKIGPFYENNPEDPTGGISSVLFSAEYLQNIIKPIDLFVFIDGGSISQSKWAVNEFFTAAGVGVRLDIGRALPLVIGYGWPLNDNLRDKQEERLFFSMAGQF